MKKHPSPTTIIYHTEAGYAGQEVRWGLKEKPEVDKPFIKNGQDIADAVVIPKAVELVMLGPMNPREYSFGPTPVYSVVCEIPKTITVTMGCGHTQTVPNVPDWIIADGDPRTKCQACWNQIDRDMLEAEEYNTYNCYEDYYDE